MTIKVQGIVKSITDTVFPAHYTYARLHPPEDAANGETPVLGRHTVTQNNQIQDCQLAHTRGDQTGWLEPAAVQENGYMMQKPGIYRVHFQVTIQGYNNTSGAAHVLHEVTAGVRTRSPVLDDTTGGQAFNLRDTDGDGPDLDANGNTIPVYLWDGDELDPAVPAFTDQGSSIAAKTKSYDHSVSGAADNFGDSQMTANFYSFIELQTGHLVLPYVKVSAGAFPATAARFLKAHFSLELVDYPTNANP